MQSIPRVSLKAARVICAKCAVFRGCVMGICVGFIKI